MLQEKGKPDNDVYCLTRISGSVRGDSAGIAHYLALYSLLHRVPLPRNLGSTGAIEGQKVGAIGGLKFKLGANTVKKKPINTFILSVENKNNEPRLNNSYPNEDSYEHIHSSIKKKIKQVEFVRFTNEIPLALERILNPEMKSRNIPVPEKHEAKAAEIQATPEQLLAFMFDSGFCGVNRNEGSKTKKDEKGGIAIPPASPENGPLQNILSIEFGKKGVFEKIRNLYYEHKQKLNSNSDINE